MRKLVGALRAGVGGGFAMLALAAAAPAQVWEVDDLALAPATPDASGFFGHAIAVGDFNGDGYDDLATGSPGADSSEESAGTVQVQFGGGGRTFSFVVETALLDDHPEAQLGFALAAGNFDSSPQDELAIGAPGASDGTFPSGRVCVISVSPSVGGTCFSQLSIPAPAGGAGADGDLFGAALAVGDFDGDGYDDLAIGAPLREQAVPAAANAGRVYVLHGASGGLAFDATAEGFFAADAQAGARFGRALAAGDFNGDGLDDLAIGEPGRTLNAQASAGRVVVAYGEASGLDVAGAQLLSNGSFGITHEAQDQFGLVLAAGDFDRANIVTCAIDGCADDLAIGSPLEDVGAQADAGIVVVTYGVVAGELSTTFFQLLDQSDLGYNVEGGDLFGHALAAGQLDSTGALDALRTGDDLVIGSPGEVTGLSLSHQGVAHLLRAYGTEGLDAGANQIVELRQGLAAAPAQEGDLFALSLAIGDFDGDGAGDVAIGIPGRNTPEIVDAGLLQVMFGGLFGDGFERGTPAGWSLSVP